MAAPAKAQPEFIRFTTRLYTIDSWTILRLPEEASKKLPSRGQTMVEGTINGASFRSPLEPDGRWSHWLHLGPSLLQIIRSKPGDNVTVSLVSTKAWPEPDIPSDIRKALKTNTKASELWHRITPMARWEWIRWIRATNSQETRAHRIEVACSKLQAGERRPCCWNRNLCTEPRVSKNGQLLLPPES